MVIPFLDLIDDEKDKQNFEKLYTNYHNLVMGICMQHLKNNQALSEECVQDIYFEIANHIADYPSAETKRAKNKVCMLARSRATDVYRKEFNPKIADCDENYLEEIEEKFFDRYASVDIANAMDNLSELRRTIIYLSYVYGYTSKEIGEKLGISDSSVRKHIQFAKQDVRKYLEGYVK